jgi:hypothetical protein
MTARAKSGNPLWPSSVPLDAAGLTNWNVEAF